MPIGSARSAKANKILPAHVDEALAVTLHRTAKAEQWDVPPADFAAALESSVAKGTDGERAPADVERFLNTIHLEDLALTCACARGHEAAWHHFILQHRPALYRAAAAIDASGGARDLADSLYAELYGLQARDGVRQSLFRYFHGRSSLGTWLRAILAQRHVDRVRSNRRLAPLPDEDSPTAIVSSRRADEPERGRFVALMQLTLAAAVARLAPRDRLRLAWYYSQDMTLAAIGRLLKEHEGTVSRHLTRCRRAIREDVEIQLSQDHCLSGAEIDERFASISEDAGPLDLGTLFGETADRKNPALDRSTSEGTP